MSELILVFLVILGFGDIYSHAEASGVGAPETGKIHGERIPISRNVTMKLADAGVLHFCRCDALIGTNPQ